jgi:hypothetical protein
VLPFRAPRGRAAAIAMVLRVGFGNGFRPTGKIDVIVLEWQLFARSRHLALFEIETGEIALVDSRASVEPTAGTAAPSGITDWLAQAPAGRVCS